MTWITPILLSIISLLSCMAESWPLLGPKCFHSTLSTSPGRTCRHSWYHLNFVPLEATFCVTQLMLYTGDKLSSTIFCLWVSVSGIGNTRPNLHFFQYIQAYKPFADHVPPNIKQYQLILTQYHQVPASMMVDFRTSGFLGPTCLLSLNTYFCDTTRDLRLASKIVTFLGPFQDFGPKWTLLVALYFFDNPFTRT